MRHFRFRNRVEKPIKIITNYKEIVLSASNKWWDCSSNTRLLKPAGKSHYKSSCGVTQALNAPALLQSILVLHKGGRGVHDNYWQLPRYLSALHSPLGKGSDLIPASSVIHDKYREIQWTVRSTKKQDQIHICGIHKNNRWINSPIVCHWPVNYSPIKEDFLALLTCLF